MIKKNTSGQFVYFALVAVADGTAHTGQTPTGLVSINETAQTGMGGSIAELAGGQYKMVLSQGDTNGDEIGYYITNSGSIPVSISVTTETKKMADLQDIAAGAAMNLAADAIKKVSYDESTAYALESADTGNSQVARVGADGDTLESLSDEIAALPTDANVRTECAGAIQDVHLDHLLAVEWVGQGAAGSILKDLLVDDAGTYQFTTNSLENGPSGGTATVEKQDEILVDIVDIKGTAFTKDTNSLVNLAITGADSDTLEDISDEIAALPDAAAIETAVDASIVTYHLDHLLHTTYDPASKPGAADALLNELIENNAGVSRYTTGALAQAPSGTGGDATAANQVLLLEDIVDMKGTAFAKDTHSLVNSALVGADADTLEVLSDQLDNLSNGITIIIEDTGTTLDGKLNTVITAVGTTLDGKIDTIDGLVDTIKDILEGDIKIDTATTPWQYLVRKNTDVNWTTPLVQQDLKTVGGVNITAVTGIIGQQIEP